MDQHTAEGAVRSAQAPPAPHAPPVEPAAPAARRGSSTLALLETYGMVAVAVVLLLFVAEMAVLVTLLRAGVDLEPMVATVGGWFGADTSGLLSTAGTFVVAYAITRLLKPFQLALAVVLTPPAHALWMRARHGAAAASSRPNAARPGEPGA
jgi:hypothetical protein